MAFDAIIAGAGIMGSSIAWRLAQQRLRVLLIDAGRMGAEASSAGAGMLAPGSEIVDRSAGSDLAFEGLRLYPAFVAELEEETGRKIDFQRLGAVELAPSGAEWQALETRGQRQAALGIPSCPLTRRDLQQHAPLARQDVAGALFYPQDALVDPRHLMVALRVGCLGRGVEIREGTPVTAVRPSGRTVFVETGRSRLETPAAVLAAGAWSSQIVVEGLAVPRAFPVRGHLMGFQLAVYSLGPILRRGHTYLLQRSSGFTVAGTSSEEVGFDRTPQPAVFSDIHRRAAEILPGLAGCQATESWLGFRPAVEGNQPVVGRAGDTSLWLAYGHHRNGILMAPATAHRIVAGITANSGTGSSALAGRLG